MKPIVSNIHMKPSIDDNRYVADVIREHDRWRRALLVLAVLLCWQMAVDDARAIVVTGEVVS